MGLLKLRMTLGSVPPAFRQCSIARGSASACERLPRATPTEKFALERGISGRFKKLEYPVFAWIVVGIPDNY